jgi:hypothetical protein
MALAIGFTTKFYTLWDVSIETNYSETGQYDVAHFCFLRNLSFDKDKAIEKAKELGCTELEPDKELYGRNNSFSTRRNEKIYNDKFQLGKYKGKLLSECDDLDYLVWYYYNNGRGGVDHFTLVKDRILELTDEYVYVNDYLITRANYEAQQRANEFEKLMKLGGELEVTVISNIKEQGGETLQIEVQLDNEDFTRKLLIDPKTQPVKWATYRGYNYALPMENGKGKRIKNKKVKLTFGEFTNYYGEELVGIKTIELIKNKK